MKKMIWFLLGIIWTMSGIAQAPIHKSASEVYADIEKLNVLGSVLYVAAHPDDENTRMISHLSNAGHYNVAYLSLTRGDGGQNLIGTEMEELLGVIRTQELLAARRIDGGNQLFSRAKDFGFSKHPDETMTFWEKDEVLADAVWAVRNWQPDVIINRFKHDTPGTTHGHHTASAMIGLEAFDKAGDTTQFANQLMYTKAWQAKRIFFNTSWWFYGSQEAFDNMDKSKLYPVDIGGYYPALGWSNTEIAAMSRSQHQCQGMGNTPTRGSSVEYLEFLKGELPSDPNDIFSGINTTWTRVEGGAPIGKILAGVRDKYDLRNPAASVPDLAKAYDLIQKLSDSYWKRVKSKEIKEVISLCLGLYLEVSVDQYHTSPGTKVGLTVEMINRSKVNVQVDQLVFSWKGGDTTLSMPLGYNESKILKLKLETPDVLYTAPYWLQQPWNAGMYRVDDRTLIGLPDSPRSLVAQYFLTIDGVIIPFERAAIYKATDPEKGEQFRPMEVLPPVFVSFVQPVLMFPTNEARAVQLQVRAGKDAIEGIAKLDLPAGWNSTPASQGYALALKGETAMLTFQVQPPAQTEDIRLTATVEQQGKTYQQELVTIDYGHIPVQSVLRKAEATLARIDMKRVGSRIGYVMGAGDKIPEALTEMGYKVDLLDESHMEAAQLKGFDAIVVGIRAYNTLERIRYYQPALLAYAKSGGTLILQYNTNHHLNLPAEELAPYSLKLSRDRVTDEKARVLFAAKNHSVLNFPNEISEKDFDGWVQERGLYYPNSWDEKFIAPLSMSDPGEAAQQGALLIAPFGEGHFVYTGLSFFRQLPAGVPGAYKLFANMLALGMENQ